MTKKQEELIHIFLGYDYTLCGWADDEIGEYWLDFDKYTDLPDPKRIKHLREEVKKMKMKRFEYGTNCKDCLKILKELRKIKK